MEIVITLKLHDSIDEKDANFIAREIAQEIMDNTDEEEITECNCEIKP